jgi:hypothetical protein
MEGGLAEFFTNPLNLAREFNKYRCSLLMWQPRGHSPRRIVPLQTTHGIAASCTAALPI